MGASSPTTLATDLISLLGWCRRLGCRADDAQVIHRSTRSTAELLRVQGFWRDHQHHQPLNIPMNTNLLALCVLVFVGCTTPTTVSSPAPVKGKPTAPVDVTAELSPKSARITVKFDADAQEVEIAASGVDGLVVDGPGGLVAKAAFVRGDTRSFDVKFTPCRAIAARRPRPAHIRLMPFRRR